MTEYPSLHVFTPILSEVYNVTEHYYTQSPKTASQVRNIDVDVKGVHLRLQTDNGVFSKNGLDDATRRLIENVQLDSRASVLDLGAGYGVVSATLGTLYPETKWTLIDINERALALAAKNTMFMADRREVIASDGIPETVGEVFTDVLLNPPIRAGKAVVYRLFADAHRTLKPSGRLWIVIQKKHGAPSALAELERLFHRVETVYKKSGYFIFVAEKNVDVTSSL
ncbi:class I SAM-dependent methyltransferase [Alicyclobacillus dauci]|uniref:Methyltransferase n=1 Tax=Alicyclobacillus dauci TaxID=1475485 RepID=A0ABY6Z4E2_9BACL|nr:methyltransferase [Alicyclobacillus dauci]WAH37383.1 methyltransferase [Alicyclobacillus dauci]